jgi:predicted transcriptional regulator
MPPEDGRNKTMSRPTRYSYSMTLRLEPSMESELEDLAYGRNLSKAGFIRRCIRQAIADAHERGTQNTHLQEQGGAL